MTRQLSIQDAAKHLNVSERTIRRRIKQGKLSSTLVEGRYLVQICLDNGMTTDKADANALLVEQLQSEIAYLREQLACRDEQIESLLQQLSHLQQLLALQTKTSAGLAEQLEASRQMLEDMRHRKPLWKRLFRRLRWVGD